MKWNTWTINLQLSYHGDLKKKKTYVSTYLHTQTCQDMFLFLIKTELNRLYLFGGSKKTHGSLLKKLIKKNNYLKREIFQTIQRTWNTFPRWGQCNLPFGFVFFLFSWFNNCAALTPCDAGFWSIPGLEGSGAANKRTQERIRATRVCNSCDEGLVSAMRLLVCSNLNNNFQPSISFLMCANKLTFKCVHA